MRDLLIRDRVGSAKPGGTWQTSSARFLLPSNNPLKERMWFFLITAWFIVSVPCPHFHFPRYNATGVSPFTHEVEIPVIYCISLETNYNDKSFSFLLLLARKTTTTKIKTHGCHLGQNPALVSSVLSKW